MHATLISTTVAAMLALAGFSPQHDAKGPTPVAWTQSAAPEAAVVPATK